MKKTFAILLASTALAVGVGIPAWSAMHHVELFSSATDRDGLVQLAGNDRGDSEHEKSARSRPDGDRHGDDDDGGEDDDDNSGSAIVNPAPAAVAPPANGLFDSGAAPKVKVN